jgi:hypothetical protein
VLLCSGYIAGGSLVGVLAAFLNFNDDLMKSLNFAPSMDHIFGHGMSEARWTTMTAFGVMLVLLLIVGTSGRFNRKPTGPVAKGVK